MHVHNLHIAFLLLLQYMYTPYIINIGGRVSTKHTVSREVGWAVFL